MTARIRTHIDLDEVEASPWACGPHTRQALVNAARALIAIVEHEHLDRYEVEELNEPWASALGATLPFRADTHGASDAPMPPGVTEVEDW
jgi:hypothetical protein